MPAYRFARLFGPCIREGRPSPRKTNGWSAGAQLRPYLVTMSVRLYLCSLLSAVAPQIQHVPRTGDGSSHIMGEPLTSISCTSLSILISRAIRLAQPEEGT